MHLGPVTSVATVFCATAALLAIFGVHFAYASLGDRLIIFDNHLKQCLRLNCSSGTALARFEARQPLALRLFGWDCTAECRLQAQWATLEQLQQKKIIAHVPQFYGKWTFYRLAGIQEPASFLFSILNFASNLVGWLQYRRVATKDGHGDPLYGVWRLQTFISLNAWAWSTVYHGRDTPLSEKLDYYSAFSVVLFSLLAVILKLLSSANGDRVLEPSVVLTTGVPFVAFFAYHIYYLHAVHFDYGYNMKVNVATGLLATACWLFWCFQHRGRGREQHLWMAVLTLLCVNLCLLFELIDFPPLLFTFDAHSLWHLCTFPLPLLWFRFLSREAVYLANSNANKEKQSEPLLRKEKKNS